MRRILSASRYLIIIAVAGAFVAASALLVYGGAKTIHLVAGIVAAIQVGSKESA
jgi:uncharacterized membrane protein YqhA